MKSMGSQLRRLAGNSVSLYEGLRRFLTRLRRLDKEMKHLTYHRHSHCRLQTRLVPLLIR